MKRIFSSIFLAGSLALLGVFPVPSQPSATAQSQSAGDLFYLYKGQRIPLNLRQDTIAVAFKPGSSRSIDKPFYQQLQQVLQSNTRGLETPEVRPLGENYALVQFANSRDLKSTIEQQSYVQMTLPVLNRNQQDEQIVLPNEVILRFRSGLTQNQQKAILDRNNLDVIRPVRFTQNQYLVRVRSADGTAILGVANQLNQVKGIQSASPNFIQASRTIRNQATFTNFKAIETPPKTKGIIRVKPENPTRFQSDLLPLEWHLNSTAIVQDRTRSLKARPDLHVTEAWQHSNAGEGVVVAVLDAFIQWDHPDLMQNVYTVGNVADKLPGEVHGWDFSGSKEGDPDTRISESELNFLRPLFQETFQLSDSQLQQKYASQFAEIQKANPKADRSDIARFVRYKTRQQVMGEFHGTMTAGVIAAKAQGGRGLLGVAPNAKILPVRVGGESGLATIAVLEAVNYATHRGADIINMSFGARLPTTDESDTIADALQANPKLVIVASSGNEGEAQLGIGFPAAVKGVVAVGATNLSGQRVPYSSFGEGLDVVAPGGDVSDQLQGGILTTCGTGIDGFWKGITSPSSAWSPAQDTKGSYIWAQGTSFSAPAIAGVFALMKGQDPSRRLSRDRLVAMLKASSSYESLTVSNADVEQYRSLRQRSKLSVPNSMQQFFFGSGLVNADLAVRAVDRAK
ncbi:S8 family peptidase [Phormidesmis priestleyi]